MSSVPAARHDKRVLCVGLICLDIVSVCKAYPLEDSDQRSVDYYWQRGGNASNSSTVLALLGANVECLGILVEGPEMHSDSVLYTVEWVTGGEHNYAMDNLTIGIHPYRSPEWRPGLALGFVTCDLHDYGIVTENCVVYPAAGNKPAVAVSVISEETGSRTIMAALNGTKELTFEDFDKVDLTNYKWIHFEGRPASVPETSIGRMMSKVRDYNAGVGEGHDTITVSLELEKVTRPELKCLTDRADCVFFSKDFAMMEGHRCKEDAVAGLATHCKPGGTVVCAWGADGAAAVCSRSRGDVITSPAFPPDTLIDTLGAGDTFNGATILALSHGHTVQDAITFGCSVAGAKCGMRGYSGIKGMQALL